MRALSAIFLVTLVLFGTVASAAPGSDTRSNAETIPSPTPQTQTASPQPGTDLSKFEEADNAFRARKDEKRAREALEKYRSLYQANKENPEAGWRLAMGCYFVGLRLTQSDGLKKEIFAEGRDAGLQAVKLKPDCASCHFWTAINMALYGQAVGAVKMLFSLEDVKKHLNESIRLDAKYSGAGAYRLLGVIDEKLPGILGGDNDRARDLYEKAIATAPDEPLNYLFLARILKEEFDDEEKARSVARTGASLVVKEAERIESIEAVQDLKDFLAGKAITK